MKSNFAKRVLVAVLPFAPVALFLGAAGVAACSRAHPDTTSGPQEGVDIAAPAPPPGPQPTFGPLVQAKEPPPPISGGTLAIASDRTTAVVADADRDRIYVVDLPARAVRHTIDLPRHSEPGRVAVDGANHAYVVLRSTGALATVDLATGGLSIVQVCLAPRGVAYDAALKAVHVACASGELVTMPTTGTGDVVRRNLDRDLRDVVVMGDGSLQVTQFRTAASFRVWKDGSSPSLLPTRDGSNLMWRAISMNPDPSKGCKSSDCSDETASVAQQPTPEPVRPEPGGYGGSSSLGSGLESGFCSSSSGIITTKVSVAGGSVTLPEAVLPVDMATNGRELAVIAAGNAFTKELPQIFVVFADSVRASNSGGCVPTVHGNVPGQAVAAAFDGNDALIVQTREPAAIHIMTEDRRRPWKTIALADDSVADTGHQLFHSNAGGFIACASCHAEGRDDGHVWTFVGQGPRRTPSLLGTIAGTEPFHWDGDMKDMRDLVDHVFVERMSGPKVDDGQLGALKGWLFALPAPEKLRQPSADTVPGQTLFTQRCASCHSGAMLTNSKNVDVGTGGSFQVPSLVGVAWRRPLLHTGCADTLQDRFNPTCGGSRHGDTSDLSPAQIADLVKFLETL